VGNLFRGALVGALRCDDKVFDDEADSCGCDSTYPKTDLREQNKGTAVFAQMAIPDRFVPSERDGPSNDLAEPNDWHLDPDPNEREQDCTEYFKKDAHGIFVEESRSLKFGGADGRLFLGSRDFGCYERSTVKMIA
jgi:hypothetical protein